MVRLVKGAYWDSEIKRAQVDGLDDFPVFTRKVHTDVSYLACARKLLAAPDAIFPQFATHNAQTLASVLTMAGPNFYRGQYEFQCLHGMGEPLYEEVVGRDKLDRPCRVYAPVGSHETLLAYLVRRLLENGANTSFVNRIADASVPIDDLIADPVAVARTIQPLGAPHDKIALPRDLYGAAAPQLARARPLRRAAPRDARRRRCERAPGRIGAPFRRAPRPDDKGEPVRNPADHSDIVGHARHAPPGRDRRGDRRRRGGRASLGATSRRTSARRSCAARPTRSKTLNDELVGLIVREAGKSYANAVAEVREAGRFPALLRGARRPGRSAPARPRRSASSPASARGTSRSRSSPARSRRRSPPATPSSPSRPRRRR